MSPERDRTGGEKRILVTEKGVQDKTSAEQCQHSN